MGGITYTVMIVSDGVSSAERSHLASEAACQTSREKMVSMLKSGEKDLVKVLTAGVDVAQKAVLALPCIGELDSRGNRKAAPEATFIAAIVAGGRATICWLGDCRAYSVARNGGATLLTKDHSWINLVVDAGEMSLADAMVAPEAHAIYQSLGPVDADNGGIFEPAFCTVDLLGARMLILCSDGFWNYGHPVQDSAAYASRRPACSPALERRGAHRGRSAREVRERHGRTRQHHCRGEEALLTGSFSVDRINSIHLIAAANNRRCSRLLPEKGQYTCRTKL